jgi:glycine/D-amino acid oxidase-like deaminating enzyme
VTSVDASVIGAGYVGLPLSLHLAKAGWKVTAVEHR